MLNKSLDADLSVSAALAFARYFPVCWIQSLCFPDLYISLTHKHMHIQYNFIWLSLLRKHLPALTAAQLNTHTHTHTEMLPLALSAHILYCVSFWIFPINPPYFRERQSRVWLPYTLHTLLINSQGSKSQAVETDSVCPVLQPPLCSIHPCNTVLESAFPHTLHWSCILRSPESNDVNNLYPP